MSRWSFSGIRSRRAIPREKCRRRGVSSRPRNPGSRSKERSPRWPGRARPRRPSSRPGIVANSVACSSSSGPGTISKPSQGGVKLCVHLGAAGRKLGNRHVLRTAVGLQRMHRHQCFPQILIENCIKGGYFLIFKTLHWNKTEKEIGNNAVQRRFILRETNI